MFQRGTSKASSLEAAAEAAAKVSAMLMAKGKVRSGNMGSTKINVKDNNLNKSAGDLFTAEVEINDAPLSARNLLTRGHTQDEINKYSGAAVSTRGRYMTYEDRAKNPTERPLYLYVQASEKSALDLGVQRIHEIIQQHMGQLQPQQTLIPNNPSNANKRPNKFSNNKFSRNPSQPVSARPPPLMSIQTSPPSLLHVDKVYICLDHAGPAFDLKNKVLGFNNTNFNFIHTESGCNLGLRGKGSGTNDPATNMESTEPMHIYLESTSMEMLQKGKECAQDLVNTLQQDFLLWHQQQAAQQQQMGAIASMQQPIQAQFQTVTVSSMGQPSVVSIHQTIPHQEMMPHQPMPPPGHMNQPMGQIPPGMQHHPPHPPPAIGPPPTHLLPPPPMQGPPPPHQFVPMGQSHQGFVQQQPLPLPPPNQPPNITMVVSSPSMVIQQHHQQLPPPPPPPQPNQPLPLMQGPPPTYTHPPPPPPSQLIYTNQPPPNVHHPPPQMMPHQPPPSPGQPGVAVHHHQPQMYNYPPQYAPAAPNAGLTPIPPAGAPAPFPGYPGGPPGGFRPDTQMLMKHPPPPQKRKFSDNPGEHEMFQQQMPHQMVGHPPPVPPPGHHLPLQNLGQRGNGIIEMLMPAQMHQQPPGASPPNNLPMPLPINKEQQSPPDGAAPERDKQLMPPPPPPPVSSTGESKQMSPTHGEPDVKKRKLAGHPSGHAARANIYDMDGSSEDLSEDENSKFNGQRGPPGGGYKLSPQQLTFNHYSSKPQLYPAASPTYQGMYQTPPPQPALGPPPPQPPMGQLMNPPQPHYSNGGSFHPQPQPQQYASQGMHFWMQPQQ
ncbi:KH homology domain-containing protein 4-like isoform X2 [Cloeon dipterum]|uniref:KH homology domain-containing protein 4-like isoform X2 n=1 Tax=Cloeon dipterum TaxID=197152 RepID=UPI00322059C7